MHSNKKLQSKYWITNNNTRCAGLGCALPGTHCKTTSTARQPRLQDNLEDRDKGMKKKSSVLHMIIHIRWYAEAKTNCPLTAHKKIQYLHAGVPVI